MKKIFEFNIPEDREDFEIHNNAVKHYLAIEDLFSEFRAVLKYEKFEDIKSYIADRNKENEEFNQNFESYPDKDELDETIDHVTSYWRDRLNKILNEE